MNVFKNNKRSSFWRYSVKNIFSKDILTGKYLCWSLFFNKVASLFFNKEIPTQAFSCEFEEIFKETFPSEHLRWVFL